MNSKPPQTRSARLRGSWLITVLAVLASGALAAGKPDALIPFDKLDELARARVRQVIPGYTFHHKVRLPHPEFRARLDLFEYLVNHLDQTSMIAQPLKIVEFRSERRPDGSYWADNRQGASGFLWPLYTANGERLYFGQGSDRKGRPIEGQAVALFRYREKAPGLIACELDTWVKLDNWFKKLLAILFLPLATGTVDRHFGAVADVPVLVCEKSTADPAQILAVINSLPPQDRAALEEFRKLLQADTRVPPAQP